jgi:hypothetical protein
MADRAVDVDDTAAASTNQVVVIVADAIFEARGRAGRLDAPDQPLGYQQAQRIVDRLQGDGTDLGPDDLGDRIGRDVGLAGNRPQDGQPLGRHLNAPFAKQRC